MPKVAVVKPGIIRLKSNPGDKKVAGGGLPGGKGGGGDEVTVAGLGGERVICLLDDACANSRPAMKYGP